MERLATHRLSGVTQSSGAGDAAGHSAAHSHAWLRAQQQHQQGDRNRHPDGARRDERESVVGLRSQIMGALTMTHRHMMRALGLGIILAACAENPAEVRNDATAFPVVANYSSTVAAIGTSGVTGTF